MYLTGLLILGIVAGILSGLFGIGGGIVLVPCLLVIFSLDILYANATSLTAMLLPVGILGVWEYYKAGQINIKESLWIALGLFLGSFVGGEIAVNINEKLLTQLYAFILLCIAVSYFNLPKYFHKKNEIIVKEDSVISKSFRMYILVGAAAGIFAGLFGKGGGIIIVPLLIHFFQYDAKKAVATSLASLQLPVGLPSVIVYAKEGYLNLLFAALIAGGMVVGAFLGSKIGIRISSEIFKKVYGVFLLAVAVYLAIKYI